MRIPQSWVNPIAKRIIDMLLAEEAVKPELSSGELIDITEALITEELMIEDRLNDEVRDILKQFQGEIDAGRMDYRKLFDMTKHKLARERNLIL